MWRSLLAEYLAANATLREADRVFHRSQRTFDKLARRIDERRAFALAGVALADKRSIKAYRAERDPEAFFLSTTGADQPVIRAA